MASHLTAYLHESHGAGWPAAGRPVRIRADHVLLGDTEGTVAMLAFEALGRARIGCALACVVPSADASGPDVREDHRYLQSAASAYGALFARPGAGAPAAIHRRRFAAPGRILVAAVPAATGAGAFGMLVFQAGPLELAAALAGEPLVRPRPPVIGVRLEAELPQGAGGAELLEALAERLGDEAVGAVLEMTGAGVAQVLMRDRIALCTLAPARMGVAGVLFPSDDRTREYLRARGRDADWRRFEGGGSGFERELPLDLAAVPVPLLNQSRVRAGALTEDDELRALAAALAMDGVPAGASLEVVTGGRAMRAALAAEGTLEALIAAGANVLDPAESHGLAAPAAEVLHLGDAQDALGDSRAFVSVARLALAWGGPIGAGAAAGTVPPAGSGARLDPAELLEPVAATPVERGAAHQPCAPPAPLDGPVRAVVVARLEGRVRAEEVLARGPRLHALRGDAGALAAQVLLAREDGAAARALTSGGGFIVVGGEYGGGVDDEGAARATAALGVRAVFAARFARAHSRVLAHHGVLPLTFRRVSDFAAIARGDELEIPGLPEALARGRRLAVRNLTRGLQFEVEHPLSEDEREAVLAGGLLNRLARSAEAVAGGLAP